MKHIAITPPITFEFTAVDNGKEIKKQQTLSIFDLIEMVCNDPLAGKDLDTIRSMNNVFVVSERAMKGKLDVIALEDDDHGTLVRIMRNPAQGYNPFVARKLIPFFEAIESPSAVEVMVPTVERASAERAS